MVYSDFTLTDLEFKFKLSNRHQQLFSAIQKQVPSPTLVEALAIARSLKIRSEKAKSELIITPILIDLMKRNTKFFTIYSGDTLIADKEQGLIGECDFILAKDTDSYNINTPIITLVEAKKSDIELEIEIHFYFPDFDVMDWVPGTYCF